jgi:hypothetical protein
MCDRGNWCASPKESTPAGRAGRIWGFGKASPTEKFSLLDLAGVRVELCELLGRDTDVVIREDVLPRFWQTIEDDLIEVF